MSAGCQVEWDSLEGMSGVLTKHLPAVGAMLVVLVCATAPRAADRDRRDDPEAALQVLGG